MSEIQFEGRLKAIGATSTKDGNWTKVEFQVHPDDDVSAMLRAGLNSRWLVVVVQLGDDEQPITAKEGQIRGGEKQLRRPNASSDKPKGGELAKAAGILCGDERFWAWANIWNVKHFDASAAAHFIRIHCMVKSRAELDHNPEAAKKFLALKSEFEQAHGMMAERYQ